MSGQRQDRQGREQRGRRAEAVAAWWLRLKGYRILARRYRTPVGELDIVAARGRVLAVIEVKARASREAALEALGPLQRRRIARAAEAFLARHPGSGQTGVRFDLVLVLPRRLPHHIIDAWRE